MPAVTVSDAMTLPVVPAPVPGSTARRVRSLSTAPHGFEGEGFPVRRAFAGVALEDLDPFIHMDQMGEVDYGPGEPKGTSWHPHRGFETVTYLLDGEFEHRDSHGGGGLLTPGDTQWMTAGSGLLHIERPPERLVMSGGRFHGVQLWVNLPQRDKLIAPRYQHLPGGDVTLARSVDGGVLLRLIAGTLEPASAATATATDGGQDARPLDDDRTIGGPDGIGPDGLAGPGATHTPIVYAHATLAAGARLDVPWNPSWNALVYVLSGNGTIGGAATVGAAGAGDHPDDVAVTAGQLAVLGEGDHLSLFGPPRDRPGATFDVLLLGGQPIREPVAWHGPFVMNTRAELVTAFEDYEAGRLGTIPADG